MLDVLFTPMKIGNCEIPNRLVVPAMVTNTCNPDGTLTDRFIKYHEEKAKGGWGLIIVEDYGVTEIGKGYPFIPGFGYRNYNPLEEAAKKHCIDVQVIGSAVKAGNALTAIHEGYEAGLKL